MTLPIEGIMGSAPSWARPFLQAKSCSHEQS
jgi:hypothetical protein